MPTVSASARMTSIRLPTGSNPRASPSCAPRAARNFIVFSGTAAQVDKTFQTRDSQLQERTAKQHFANTDPPSIPAALSGIVSRIPRHQQLPRPNPRPASADPEYTFTYNGERLTTSSLPATSPPCTIIERLSIPTVSTAPGSSWPSWARPASTDPISPTSAQNFGLSAISCTTSGSRRSSTLPATHRNFKYVLVNGTARPTSMATICRGRYRHRMVRRDRPRRKGHFRQRHRSGRQRHLGTPGTMRSTTTWLRSSP